MNLNYFFKLLLMCVLLHTGLYSQVSVVSINVQPFNIVPEALLNVGIMNNGDNQQVRLITQLSNSSGAVLLSVKSEPFQLTKGLNSGLSGDRKTTSVEYASGQQSAYLKTTHNLPSGRYKLCSSVISLQLSEQLDDFCDELEADFNQYLYLVNPLDNDTVESKNPLLSWTHSEPFTILNQGEFYRMIVSEIKKGQSPEEALSVNSPVMIKNYLKEHQVQYPYDAKELKDGMSYAWQVQKMGDGVVINKTETWKFNIRPVPEIVTLKYVALKKQLDGAFYQANDGKVYFKFSEDYNGSGTLKFTLTNSKLKQMEVSIVKDAATDEKEPGIPGVKLKKLGDNRFDLDLNSLRSDFYTLEIKNEKKETFYLKIFLP